MVSSKMLPQAGRSLLLSIFIVYAINSTRAVTSCVTSPGESGYQKPPDNCPDYSGRNDGTPDRFLSFNIVQINSSLNFGHHRHPSSVFFPKKQNSTPSQVPSIFHDDERPPRDPYSINSNEGGSYQVNGGRDYPKPNYDPRPRPAGDYPIYETPSILYNFQQKRSTTSKPSTFSSPSVYTNFYTSTSTPKYLQDSKVWSSSTSNYPDFDASGSTSKDRESNPKRQTTTSKPSRLTATDKVSTANGLLPRICGVGGSDRIVGGSPAALGQYPWMVVLEYDTPRGLKLPCGGSVITNQHILTAAHCIKGHGIPADWKLRAARLGELDTRTNPDCNNDRCAPNFQSIPIKKAFVHEGYNPATQQNDIAVLFLERPVNFTDDIKPICLPISKDIAPRLVVAGWGRNETHDFSERLLQVNLPLASKQKCIETYRERGALLYEDQICAGGEKAKDSCIGDSGGPLMQFTTKDPKYYVVGVVSFGPRDCGLVGVPGVYAEVFDFRDWILKKIGDTVKPASEPDSDRGQNYAKIIFPDSRWK